MLFYKARKFSIHFLRISGLMVAVNALNNFRFCLIKLYCRLMGKNFLERVYSDSYFNTTRWEYVLRDTPKMVATAIIDLYHPKNVVDVGCGPGFYAREFGKFGVAYLGIDGSPASLRNAIIDKSNFILQDVTEKFSLSQKYDCAICFEVGEHISTQKSEILAENLTNLSDLVFFTAAKPGQGGRDHINEQHPRFWIDIFKESGFDFLPDETGRLKEIFLRAGAVFWITENILVFRRARIKQNVSNL